MMRGLFRFFCGYVRFVYTGGFYEDFLNACYQQGCDVQRMTRAEDSLYGSCSIKTYKRLHRAAFASGGKVRIIKKCGLPFFLAPLKKRWGFFSGGVVFVLILSLLTAFIWNVEIVGNNRISTAELETYLKNNGVQVGVLWSQVNRGALSYAMLADFPDAAWVHINKIGTTARLEINERTMPPTQKTEKEKAQVGAVRKEIVLTVSRTACDTVLTGEKTYKSLSFYGMRIPFYLSKKAGDSQVETKPLVFRGKTLPVFITYDTEQYYIKNEYQLTDKELEALARKRLAQAKTEKLDETRIVNENITVTMNDKTCTITGAYILRYD